MRKVIVFTILVVGLVGFLAKDYITSRNGQNSKTIPVTLETSPITIEPLPEGAVEGKDIVSREVKYVIPHEGYVQFSNPELQNPELLHHMELHSSKQGILLLLGEEFLNLTDVDIFKNLEGYGVPVEKGEELTLYTHLRNDSPREFPNVVFKYHLNLIPQETKLKAIKPVFFHITDQNYGGIEFPVPPKVEFKKEATFVSGDSGKIVAAGGHVHDWGKYLIFKINGNQVKKFTPTYKENGEILRIEPIFPQNLSIGKGDKINLEVAYENPTQNDTDGMGILALFISP